MATLLSEVRHNPLLWLLVFVPGALRRGTRCGPRRTRCCSCLSVLAIVPLAALLSHATESVAAKTGDTVGGLLNATLGNLTELVIALAALRAGQYMLVKASIAGAIVTNSLFMLGASFLLGGLKYHVQEFNRVSARLQASLLFLATIALLIPSAIRLADAGPAAAFSEQLSLGLSGAAHRRLRARACCSRSRRTASCSPRGARTTMRSRRGRLAWRSPCSACVTVLVALVSEVFVESVQKAAESFGMTPGVRRLHRRALVGGAAEMASAFSGARKNRLDLSVGHRAGQRVADRAVRGAGAGAAQLRDRPDADGSAVLAGRGADDADRDAHRRRS